MTASAGRSRALPRIVHTTTSFDEALLWDIRQQVSMTPQERLRASRVLKRRAYSPEAKDVRECHRTR